MSCVFRYFSAALIAAIVVPGAARADTTLIVLRHGERDNSFTDALNERGRARAQALVDAMADVPLDAIYVPDKTRNRDTAAPLAAARNLPVHVIPATGLARRLVADNPDRSVMWIGNKDNLNALWSDLKANGNAPVEYGDLFVVIVGDSGAPAVSRHHFGD
jgi:hypothetical protein